MADDGDKKSDADKTVPVNRKADVFEKLDYTDHKFNDLCDELHKSGMEASEVRFLSTMAGEILTNCREVFDYCANDIVEAYIASNDSEVMKAIKESKLKCYFPFYKNQLTKRSQVFRKLIDYNEPLHSHLFSIAASIEANSTRPKSIIKYGCLRDMSDMVNEKKHNKLLVVKRTGEETIYAEVRGAKLMMPKAKQVGIKFVRLLPDTKHATGDTYVFEYNHNDMLEFAMHCRKLSRFVMEDIYNGFLS